jgi:hypothetical protein
VKEALKTQLPLIVTVVEAEAALPNVAEPDGLTLQEVKLYPLLAVAEIGTCWPGK